MRRSISPWLNSALCGLLLAGMTSAVSGADAPIRQYQFERSGQGYRLVQKTVSLPAPAANEVLVRVRAVSLNRRDVFMLAGQYPSGEATGSVPLSDGAGEVIAVGPGTTRFKVGDRVAGIFFAKWIDGKRTAAALASARGAETPGMLSERIIAHEDSLVHVPAHLSFEEAATLPCAGVTAWNALFKTGQLQAGQYVLLEGTGGVSIFGLQFAAAAGARPIITSSSDAKLERARALGAVGTVNYRTNPDWEQAVMQLTGGAGVDQVLEVGGQDTMPKALSILAMDGHMALIGGLSGFGGAIPAGALMRGGARVTGIYVGSRADFEAMNAFIAQHGLKPVVDKVFDFEQTEAAYQYMESGSHFGKIVIRL